MLRTLACTLFAFSATAFAQIPTATPFRDPMYSVRVTKDIEYGAAFNDATMIGEVLLLDVYESVDDGLARRPALVWLHGGGFYMGSKNDLPSELLGKWLAARGYVFITADYRLHPPGGPYGSIGLKTTAEDGKAAVRWIRKNADRYRVDPDRIAWGGDSAGAGSAIYGAWGDVVGTSGNLGFRSDVACVVDFWGWQPFPLTKKPLSLFITHGTLDTAVSYSHATNLYTGCNFLGIPVELVTLIGADHSPWDRWVEFLPPLVHFLYEGLKLRQLTGVIHAPGYTTIPHVLAVQTTGREGDGFSLYLSLSRDNNPDLGPGDFALGPIGLTLVKSGLFGLNTPNVRTPTELVFLPLPDLRGVSLYWQTAYFRSSAPIGCSNVAAFHF